jgi:hypothetical protein
MHSSRNFEDLEDVSLVEPYLYCNVKIKLPGEGQAKVLWKILTGIPCPANSF